MRELRCILGGLPQSPAGVPDSSCHCSVLEQGTLTPLLSVRKNNSSSGGGTGSSGQFHAGRQGPPGSSLILGNDTGPRGLRDCLFLGVRGGRGKLLVTSAGATREPVTTCGENAAQPILLLPSHFWSSIPSPSYMFVLLSVVF